MIENFSPRLCEVVAAHEARKGEKSAAFLRLAAVQVHNLLAIRRIISEAGAPPFLVGVASIVSQVGIDMVYQMAENAHGLDRGEVDSVVSVISSDSEDIMKKLRA